MWVHFGNKFHAQHGVQPLHQRPQSETVLEKWLRSKGMSRYQLAHAIGCDEKSVTHWADGRTLPSLVYAFKIEQATQGGVPVASWLGTELGRKQWNDAGADWKNRRRKKLLAGGARQTRSRKL